MSKKDLTLSATIRLMIMESKPFLNKVIILRIVQICIALSILFNWCVTPVSGEPQVISQKPTTILYDQDGMRIRNESPDNVKLSKNEGTDNKEVPPDPFKPTTGHVPGGLPMISDSAFSLTILIYVSVAFLLVFFLFCWKTNGGNGSSQADGLVKECPLMTNPVDEPKVIPPTPSCESKFIDIEMSKI